MRLKDSNLKIVFDLSEKSMKVDPKEIIIKLFDEKLKLYQECQLMLHIVSYASSKASCESIVESLVSAYEYASDERKGFTDLSQAGGQG